MTTMFKITYSDIVRIPIKISLKSVPAKGRDDNKSSVV